MGKHANWEENTYSQSITINMLPVDMRALNELAKKRGCSRNQIMREALHKFLEENKALKQTPGKRYKIKIISKRDGSILDTLICDYNEDVPLAEDIIIANYCQTHGIHRLDILIEKEY